jgi:hypothetical protein
LETQKTANSQGNTQQKEQCWTYHNTQLQTILQSHSNKYSMPTLFLIKLPKTYDAEKTASIYKTEKERRNRKKVQEQNIALIAYV